MNDANPPGWLYWSEELGAQPTAYNFEDDVLEFHEAAGSTVGKTPGFRDVELRMNLIREEVEELERACREPAYVRHVVSLWNATDEPDFTDALKELCDLLYVTFGTAVAWGVDIAPFFERVHQSNMTKTPFTKREDGKALKGPNYQPPSFDGLL